MWLTLECESETLGSASWGSRLVRVVRSCCGRWSWFQSEASKFYAERGGTSSMADPMVHFDQIAVMVEESDKELAWKVKEVGVPGAIQSLCSLRILPEERAVQNLEVVKEINAVLQGS